jgi:hypothetical protein
MLFLTGDVISVEIGVTMDVEVTTPMLFSFWASFIPVSSSFLPL